MSPTTNSGIGDLSGKVAVLTGAGSGIGLAAASSFTAAGARVIGLDWDERGRADVEQAVGADGWFAQVDVSDRGAVEAAIADVEQRAGRVDVLVNSAGIREVGGALEITDEEWQHVLDVDLTGSFHCCRAVAAGMLERGTGSIVNISSLAGILGFRRRTAYTVAKHGVVGLTRVLAAEFGPAGVRVNAICPGLVVTPLTADYVHDPDIERGHRALVPLGRAATAEEVANAALFLAGDGSSFISGAVLPVDGGFTAVGTYDVSGGSGFETTRAAGDATT